MRYAEVNARFTAKVAEYIANGYVFNSSTMSGSQGEIAKVDLTNGKEIIRVMLERVHGRENDIKELGVSFWYDGLKLTVGRSTGNLKPNVADTWQTLWNNKIDVLFEEVYYSAGRNNEVLVTREEAIEAYKKRVNRWHNCHDSKDNAEDITLVAAPVVLSFVKRQPKCSRVKLGDINSVVRAKDNGKTRYIIHVKNRTFTLK